MQTNVHRRFSNSALLVAGIFVLGLVLRLGWIDAHSLWDDEVLSIETARSGLSFIFANRFGWLGNQTPWHYALIWLMSQPVDPTATSVLVRLPSALAGAFLPLVVYGLGRELFTRSAGLIAALMIALSPVMLDYSHDVRPYSLLAFLTAASVYCLVVAQRTGKAIHWAGFVVATVANLLNAYVALTLAMPPLGLYLAWSLWRTWRRRREPGERRNFIYLLVASGVLALVGGAMLSGVLGVPHSPVDWSKLSITSVAGPVTNLLTWFTGLGIAGGPGSLISMGLLLMAMLGVYAGVRSGHRLGVGVCAIFCLVPALILAVLITSNVVYQRYVLFIGPFYFLLIGNAIAAAFSSGVEQSEKRLDRRMLRVGGAALVASLVLVFCLGAVNYVNPQTHSSVSFRPDYRGVASYLSGNAKPQDLIIVADDPRLGYNVADFYWHGQPPAHAYDVRDPLLFRQSAVGDVYWVVSSLDTQLAEEISTPGEGWVEVVKLERVAVLKESSSGRTVDTIVEQMADKLDALQPNYQPTLTMKGGVLQARGDLAGAAKMYQAAGTYFDLGDEALRTAEGFAALGMDAQAWREGLNAKGVEPYRADVHVWLAQELQREGYSGESQAEGRIAAILQADEDSGSGPDSQALPVGQP